jgi:hypothetical protein
MVVTTVAYPKTNRGILISNIATQLKHHAYAISRTLTGPGHCDRGQSRQINWPITLSTVA